MSKKVPPKKEQIRRLEKFTELQPVKLTDEEFHNFAKQLSAIDKEILDAKMGLDSMKKQMNSKVSGLQSKRSELSTIVDREEEYRMVDIETSLDFNADLWTKIRMDTGEIIKSRPISAQERQEEAF